MSKLVDLITAWIAAHPKVAAAVSALVSAVVTALLADVGVTVPAP